MVWRYLLEVILRKGASKMKLKKYKGMQGRRAVYGYLFIAPFILGFLAFMVRPFIQSLWMSLSEVTVGIEGFQMKFWGLESYKKALTVDPEFTKMLYEEFVKMITNSLATMVFSFFVALLLNQKFKGRAFVRAIFFLPVILSSGVLVGLEYNNTLLQGMQEVIQESNTASITAVLENILKETGIGTRAFGAVFDIVNSVYDVAIASGIQIIIFLSGLQAISSSMYEAADIEGCTRWESLWKITLPMISSLILVNWIYTIIDFFVKSDNQIIEKINEAMITNMDYGFSSAMAWIYFGVIMAIIGISSFIISKVVYYYE